MAWALALAPTPGMARPLALALDMGDLATGAPRHVVAPARVEATAATEAMDVSVDFRTSPLDAVEPALEATFEASIDEPPRAAPVDAEMALAIVSEIAARRRAALAGREALVVLSAVPEPEPLSTMAAGLVGLTLLGRAWRRR